MNCTLRNEKCLGLCSKFYSRLTGLLASRYCVYATSDKVEKKKEVDY